MAAPRLHLSNIGARSGVSEDEEVEVLGSDEHDDDLENGNSLMAMDGEGQESGRVGKDAKTGLTGWNDSNPLVVDSGNGHSPPSDHRSETSTPEADAAEAAMAALYASTRSEAVPGHQEASDRLQDKTAGPPRRPVLAGLHFPSGPGQAGAGGLYTSTPTTTDGREPESGQEGLAPSPNRESFWNEEDVRRALHFFFMNPLEKYRATRRFPWKLALQVMKIVLVTTQLIVFGDMRMGHANFSFKTKTALRHLFLANWTSDRDLLIYPPVVPQFSIYEINNFYSHLTYAVRKYYILPNVSIATLVYDCAFDEEVDSINEDADGLFKRYQCAPPPLRFCVEQLQAAESHLANHTYHYDMRTVTTCLDVDLKDGQWNSTLFSIKALLDSHNVTIQKQRFVQAALTFKLKTIHLKRLQPADEPDCFHLIVNILYDNSPHTGEIVVSLDTLQTYINCEGSIEFPTYNVALAVLVSILDAIVLIVCTASLSLCLRALRTNQFFIVSFGHGMVNEDRLKFINFWYLLIMVNDVCLIMGTIFKLSIEYQQFDASLFTAAGMLLGLGTLIVWAGVLRYLAFFPKYNVLVITLKRSLPNVLRFMACAGLLYTGFVFCGWVVLGPYHMKFRTLMMTSECLFSLLNGDDMFATFATTSSASPAVLWFARLYLYTFISLFTYVVLSLFISIIMEAYEVMKDRQQYQLENSDLDSFMGIGHMCADNSAAAGPVPGSLLGDLQSPSGGILPRMRRRFSRQRSSHADETPYVRFENEPVIIDNQDVPTSSVMSHA